MGVGRAFWSCPPITRSATVLVAGRRSCTRRNPTSKLRARAERNFITAGYAKRVGIQIQALIQMLGDPFCLFKPLRSVIGERESGAEGGEKRVAERNRSATPPPSRRRKPAAFVAVCECPLVTSARFAEWKGRGREWDRGDQQPVERSKPCVGHGERPRGAALKKQSIGSGAS